MNTTSLGGCVLLAWQPAGPATNPANRIGSKSANGRVIFTIVESRRLFALRRCTSGQSERRGDRDSPSFWSPDEHSLGYAARGRILLGHSVAVGAVDDTRHNRYHAQILGDERVRPGRIPSTAPGLVDSLRSASAGARQ